MAAMPPTIPGATLAVDYLEHEEYEGGTLLSSGSSDTFACVFYGADGEVVDQLTYAKQLKREGRKLVVTGISHHLRTMVGVDSVEQAQVTWTLTPSKS